MLRYATPHHATPRRSCHTTPHHTTRSRHATPRHLTPRQTTSPRPSGGRRSPPACRATEASQGAMRRLGTVGVTGRLRPSQDVPDDSRRCSAFRTAGASRDSQVRPVTLWASRDAENPISRWSCFKTLNRCHVTLHVFGTPPSRPVTPPDTPCTLMRMRFGPAVGTCRSDLFSQKWSDPQSVDPEVVGRTVRRDRAS